MNVPPRPLYSQSAYLILHHIVTFKESMLLGIKVAKS